MPDDDSPRFDSATVQSIYDDCVTEAEKFKWIASEKAGFDLGERAIRDWVQEHWSGYLRAKWLEHLQGVTFWIELDRGDFGLLRTQFQDRRELLDPILEKLKQGWENLDVLCWAKQQKLPLEAVVDILEALDINSRRLAHKFDR
jgi:hypothetical protein